MSLHCWALFPVREPADVPAPVDQPEIGRTPVIEPVHGPAPSSDLAPLGEPEHRHSKYHL